MRTDIHKTVCRAFTAAFDVSREIASYEFLSKRFIIYRS